MVSDVEKKHIPALWFKMFIAGFLLSSSAYAVSLEEEAKKAYLDYLANNNYIIICVDSFYMYLTEGHNKDEWAVIQGKAFSVELKSEQITYADKLNGLEWKGSAALQPKAMRVYNAQNKWSPWEDSTPNNEFWLLGKKDGKWIVEPPTKVSKKSVKDGKSIDCKEIESMTK